MSAPDVTRLLQDLEGGDRAAFDRLLAAVYPELREMARARLRDQRAGHTLNPTGLVHEAYLRLVRYQDVSWKGRAHFFGAAATTMRRVLVDYARKKSADKRRGEHVSLTLAGDAAEADVTLEELLAIDDALERLAQERPRWVRVVECRYFAGLTLEETAEALGVSHGTVSNDWAMARAWLRRELAT
ncbi:MAG TPA: sigma-70 family RNA polymerase sigma factor [Rubricoccaceae bacterium]|nr:sigma-70 family RNA polymerase sigma factor [Rubricoccaceae bacterium]